MAFESCSFSEPIYISSHSDLLPLYSTVLKLTQFLNADISISVTLLLIKTRLSIEQSANAFFEILVIPSSITTILIFALYLFHGVLPVVKSCISPLPLSVNVPLLSSIHVILLFVPKLPLSIIAINVTLIFISPFGMVKALSVNSITLPSASVISVESTPYPSFGNTSIAISSPSAAVVTS